MVLSQYRTLVALHVVGNRYSYHATLRDGSHSTAKKVLQFIRCETTIVKRDS